MTFGSWIYVLLYDVHIAHFRFYVQLCPYNYERQLQYKMAHKLRRIYVSMFFQEIEEHKCSAGSSNKSKDG